MFAHLLASLVINFEGGFSIVAQESSNLQSFAKREFPCLYFDRN